jgi:hypothetical protein
MVKPNAHWGAASPLEKKGKEKKKTKKTKKRNENFVLSNTNTVLPQ